MINQDSHIQLRILWRNSTWMTSLLSVVCAALVLSASCRKDKASQSESEARELSSKGSPLEPKKERTPVTEVATSHETNQTDKPFVRKKPKDDSRTTQQTEPHDNEGEAQRCEPMGKAIPLWPSDGPTSIISLGNDFLVAAYVRDDQGEAIILIRFSSQTAPQTITTSRLENPLKSRRMTPPGLGALDQRILMLAVTDRKGTIFGQKYEIGKANGNGQLNKIGEGADIRFAPAITTMNGLSLIAWTVGTTPMQSRIALLDKDAQPKAVHSIAPPSMGAAAPVFIQGLSSPILLTIDARDGFSPLLQIPVKADGTPGQIKVLGPVGMVTTPVELAAAHGPMGTYATYTGIGKGATSAIGIIKMDPVAGSPQPLIRGTAYSRLHVAAAVAPNTLIFAADAPLTSGKDPDHEVQIFLVDSQGIGPKNVVRGPDGTASEVSLARNRQGLIAVVYCSQSALFATLLNCHAKPSR